MFGLPYLVSPEEAEAQCAALEQIRLTQGSITDDNDVFLFGGKTVYRNFFSQNKDVEVYQAEDIETRLSKTHSIYTSLFVGVLSEHSLFPTVFEETTLVFSTLSLTALLSPPLAPRLSLLYLSRSSSPLLSVPLYLNLLPLFLSLPFSFTSPPPPPPSLFSPLSIISSLSPSVSLPSLSPPSYLSPLFSPFSCLSLSLPLSLIPLSMWQ